VDIALIAADNGFGHVKRCLGLAHTLSVRGHKVVLFAPSQQVRKVAALLQVSVTFPIIDFQARIRQRYSLSSPPEVLWPDLSAFDLVVSDSVLEALRQRSDTILLSNFFWHSCLPGTSAQVRAADEELLMYHPLIFGSRIFAMADVRNQPGFQPLGLFLIPSEASAKRSANREHIPRVLFAVGKSPDSETQIRRFEPELRFLASQRQVDVVGDISASAADTIWEKPRDPRFAFNFTPHCYASLDAAIVRPGLGTITQLLALDIPILPIADESNLEMQNNAMCLLEIGASTSFIDYLVPQNSLDLLLRETLDLRYRIEPGEFLGIEEFLETLGL
jgi:hypothetical protein